MLAFQDLLQQNLSKTFVVAIWKKYPFQLSLFVLIVQIYIERKNKVSKKLFDFRKHHQMNKKFSFLDTFAGEKDGKRAEQRANLDLGW